MNLERKREKKEDMGLIRNTAFPHSQINNCVAKLVILNYPAFLYPEEKKKMLHLMRILL